MIIFESIQSITSESNMKNKPGSANQSGLEQPDLDSKESLGKCWRRTSSCRAELCILPLSPWRPGLHREPTIQHREDTEEPPSPFCGHPALLCALTLKKTQVVCPITQQMQADLLAGCREHTEDISGCLYTGLQTLSRNVCSSCPLVAFEQET